MRRRVGVAILTLTLSLLLLTSLALGDLPGELRVSFIDVGQSDSILLHASDNTDIVIDGGQPLACPGAVAHGKQE